MSSRKLRRENLTLNSQSKKGDVTLSILENFTEDLLEEAAIEIFQEMDYTHAFGPDISQGGDYQERNKYKDVILEQRI